MKNSKFLSGFFLLVIVSSCYSQMPKKDEIYIFFKPEDGKMYKEVRGIDDADGYVIYRYFGHRNKRNQDVRYAYVPIKNVKPFYKDDRFAKSHVKKIEQLIDIPGFLYYTSDTARFPFKKVFIAEFIEPNKYKIIQVESYLGSDY